jgi:hypothetical protein
MPLEKDIPTRTLILYGTTNERDILSNRLFSGTMELCTYIVPPLHLTNGAKRSYKLIPNPRTSSQLSEFFAHKLCYWDFRFPKDCTAKSLAYPETMLSLLLLLHQLSYRGKTTPHWSIRRLNNRKRRDVGLKLPLGGWPERKKRLGRGKAQGEQGDSLDNCRCAEVSSSTLLAAHQTWISSLSVHQQ